MIQAGPNMFQLLKVQRNQNCQTTCLFLNEIGKIIEFTFRY